MAKKNSFDIFNAIDESILDTLKTTASPVAPTSKEVELVKEAEGDVRMLPVSSLRPYHNHTFKVLDNEDMELLVDSIRDYGIILPLIVRELNGGGYELISGHRRHFAAKKLGLKEVPCKVMDLDDDMADIIMADTNLARERILPSEKARTYKVRLEAAVRLGKGTEDELKVIADESPDSLSKIRRYLKLNNLSPALLERVDAGTIPVMAGVILSDLTPQTQEDIEAVISENDLSPSLKEAEKLKKAGARGLNKESVEDILLGRLAPRTSRKKKPKEPVFTEDMLSEVVPDDIKALPLDERVEYYKSAIRAFAGEKSE